MAYHLTVAGQPLCRWTGCQAHRNIAARYQVAACEYVSGELALAALDRLALVRPDVALHAGPCPDMAQ